MEILAVLVLIGILVSTAAIALRPGRRTETPEQFLARFETWAEQARHQAERERRPWAIELHPGNPVLTLHPDGETASRPFTLPAGWELIAVRGERLTWSGQPLLLPLDPHGQGSTIALELRDPQQDYQFLVLAGLTGQAVWHERKEDADAWFPAKTDLQ